MTHVSRTEDFPLDCDPLRPVIVTDQCLYELRSIIFRTHTTTIWGKSTASPPTAEKAKFERIYKVSVWFTIDAAYPFLVLAVVRVDSAPESRKMASTDTRMSPLQIMITSTHLLAAY